MEADNDSSTQGLMHGSSENTANRVASTTPMPVSVESEYEEIIILAKGDEPGKVGILPGGNEILHFGSEAIKIGPDGKIYILAVCRREI